MIRRRMTVKRVDPWSVLKLGLVVNIAGAAILVITGMVVWSVIRRLQLIERVCEQAQSLLGFESCTINGVDIMRSGLLLAGLLVVVATGVMVFLAFLYNLIADLTGGIEVSMLDHTAGRSRTASGGVEVAPELRRDTTGTSRRRAPESTGTPVMTSSTSDQTISSAAARPNTQVPLAQDTATEAASTSRPGMLDRVAATGAVVRGAADRTGAALSEAGRRATSALADATEGEAESRARRTEAAQTSLDDLATDPMSDTGELPVPDRPRSDWPGHDPQRRASGSGNGRSPSAGPSAAGGGGSAGGSPTPSARATSEDGQGSDPSPGRADRPDDGARSPQEAAAARVRARTSSGSTSSSESDPDLPRRDSDGRFVSLRNRDEQADDLFGQHPGRGDRDDD